jgi:Skp family chaperone for outer membrane proteins
MANLTSCRALVIWAGLFMGGTSGICGQESSGEKPRAAVVNIQELFRAYYKTQAAQLQINDERARIQKSNNDLLQRIRVMDEALRAARLRIQDPALPDEERSALQREIGLRFQDKEQLERDRQQSVQARHRDLNEKMVARMSGILNEIRQLIRDRAEGEGFDLVFDVAGLNSSQVPFVLYAKDATDLTPVILELLEESAPSKE